MRRSYGQKTILAFSVLDLNTDCWTFHMQWVTEGPFQRNILVCSENWIILENECIDRQNHNASCPADVKFSIAVLIRYRRKQSDSGIQTIINQKLISSSVSRHLSTRNISSKSMHAFLSNLAKRQTDRQTNMGKNIYLLLRRR